MKRWKVWLLKLVVRRKGWDSIQQDADVALVFADGRWWGREEAMHGRESVRLALRGIRHTPGYRALMKDLVLDGYIRYGLMFWPIALGRVRYTLNHCIQDGTRFWKLVCTVALEALEGLNPDAFSNSVRAGAMGALKHFSEYPEQMSLYLTYLVKYMEPETYRLTRRALKAYIRNTPESELPESMRMLFFSLRKYPAMYAPKKGEARPKTVAGMFGPEP